MQNNIEINSMRGADNGAFNRVVDECMENDSILGLPLLDSDTPIGAIICRNKLGFGCFRSSDLQALQIASTAAGSILNSAWQYHRKMSELRQVQNAQDKLAALVGGAERICKQTDTDEVIAQILDLACALVEADRGSFFLIDSSGRRLISKVANGQDKPFLFPIKKGIAGHVASTGEIVNVADVYDDPRFDSSTDKQTGYRTKSMLAVPVFDQKHQPVAVVQLMNKMTGREFTEADTRLVQAACVFTGISVVNSSIIQCSISATTRFEALLSTAIILTRNK
jgi:GAF domain-containing protein